MLKFPLSVEYALFTGVEQEGKFKGVPTLFIVGDTSKLDAVNERIEELAKTYKHVYLGAGGRFGYPSDEKYIDWLCGLFPAMTIESPSLNKVIFFLQRRVHWMLPLVWQGQMLPVAKDALDYLSQFVGKPSSAHRAFSERLQLKFDFGNVGCVLVLPFTDAVFSRFEDYGEDVLLEQCPVSAAGGKGVTIGDIEYEFRGSQTQRALDSLVPQPTPLSEGDLGVLEDPLEQQRKPPRTVAEIFDVMNEKDDA